MRKFIINKALNFALNRIFFLLITFLIPVTASSARKTTATGEKVDMFAQVSVPKECYIGESVEYIVTLFSSTPDVADVKLRNVPEFPVGCEVTRGVVNNNKPSEVKVKGKKLYSWTILRYFITFTEAGKYSLNSLDAIAYIGRERIVQDFFWGARRTMDYDQISVETETKSIKVKDLPAYDTGKTFSGCVGIFSIEGWFPPGRMSIGSEAIVVFDISGFGNLTNLKLTDISGSFTSGCKLKEVRQDEDLSQRDGKLFSQVSLTCFFIPDAQTGIISPIEMTFFNPEKGKYETIKSSPLEWNCSEEKVRIKPSDILEI